MMGQFILQSRKIAGLYEGKKTTFEKDTNQSKWKSEIIVAARYYN